MQKLVEYTYADGIATLTLNNGKANAISHALIEDFNLALDQAQADAAVVVITGQGGILSAGYDLAVMKESMQAAMQLVEKGSTLTRRLLAFPTPVIAACPGHAVAKGAFLLLACDYRIGVSGDFKIGLNEVAIGMAMHQAGVELAKGRMSSGHVTRSVICAEMCSPETAVEFGFLDTVVEPQQFDAVVTQTAKLMSKLDRRAHQQTKLKVRKGLLERLDSAIQADIGASV